MEFCLCLDLNWTDRGSWLDNWDYLLSLTINYGLSHTQHRPTGQCWGWSLLVENWISWEWRRWLVPHCNVWWTRPETVSKHEIASEILSILGWDVFTQTSGQMSHREGSDLTQIRGNIKRVPLTDIPRSLYIIIVVVKAEEESFTALTNMKQLSWRLWAVGGNIDYFSIWK